MGIMENSLSARARKTGFQIIICCFDSSKNVVDCFCGTVTFEGYSCGKMLLSGYVVSMVSGYGFTALIMCSIGRKNSHIPMLRTCSGHQLLL